MKKLLGGLLSLAMMFSLTPSTIALADHESADVGVESSQSQVDESVSSIQTRINNLVGVEGVTDENRDTVYKFLARKPMAFRPWDEWLLPVKNNQKLFKLTSIVST